MRSLPQIDSQRTGQLENGDEVEILQDVPVGWYQVRVVASKDLQRVKQVGWVESWLVNNQNVPPPPPPLPPLFFRIDIIRSFPDTGSSGQRQSCVKGAVLRQDGKGIAGAALYANNG